MGALQAIGSIVWRCQCLPDWQSGDLIQLVHTSRNRFALDECIQKSAPYAYAHLAKGSTALATGALFPIILKDMQTFEKDPEVQRMGCLAVKHICEGVGIQCHDSEARSVLPLIRRVSDDSDDDEAISCAQQALDALKQVGINADEVFDCSAVCAA